MQLCICVESSPSKTFFYMKILVPKNFRLHNNSLMEKMATFGKILFHGIIVCYIYWLASLLITKVVIWNITSQSATSFFLLKYVHTFYKHFYQTYLSYEYMYVFNTSYIQFAIIYRIDWVYIEWLCWICTYF